ncbi:MAG: DNA-processing protein DprA [Pseudomonadota bacterium]
MRRTLLAVHAATGGDFSKLPDFLSISDEQEALATARRVGIEPDWHAADRASSWLESSGHALLSITDADYPLALRNIPVPPTLLFVSGNYRALKRPQIAIVGSRKCTRTGAHIAQRLASAVVAQDVAVTSGLALGIDGAAHDGALSNAGATIAVLGNGLARVYPQRHRALAERIGDKGALVSEFPLSAAPLPFHFPRRNRIISGLSQGVVVVQATLKSGSLGTARHAIEQGRDVFAVPGPVWSKQHAGCHALIKQGAKLIECAADVFEDLGFEYREAVDTQASAPSVLGNQILNAIEDQPISIDELVTLTGLTAQKVSSILSAMELEGLVISSEGGRFTRSGP